MNEPWPMVPLGEVLTQRKEFVQIDDEQEYKRCRVQLHAQGVILRDIAPGAAIKTKRQQVCHTGEFLVAEIDAKVGGFGLVPANLEGAIVSSHYFLFRINTAKVEPRFLDFYVRTRDFREQVSAQGTTNYAAVRPGDVLTYQMPLPPLTEQQRIVARIEELAAKIEEARGLRRATNREAEQLFTATIDAEMNCLAANHPVVRVSEVEVLITSGPRNFSSRYTESGLRFYRAQDITADGHVAEDNAVYVEVPEGMNTRAIVRQGDVAVVITGATIGRSAVIDEHLPTGLVSQHVGLVRVDSSKVEPTFLHYAMLSPAWAGGQLNEVKYGQGKPGLNLSNLRNLAFPLPPVTEQQRVVAHLDNMRAQADALKQLQAETAAELDALLPSVLDRAFKGEL